MVRSLRESQLRQSPAETKPYCPTIAKLMKIFDVPYMGYYNIAY
jgi:hypothetical protein